MTQYGTDSVIDVKQVQRGFEYGFLTVERMRQEYIGRDDDSGIWLR